MTRSLSWLVILAGPALLLLASLSLAHPPGDRTDRLRFRRSSKAYSATNESNDAYLQEQDQYNMHEHEHAPAPGPVPHHYWPQWQDQNFSEWTPGLQSTHHYWQEQQDLNSPHLNVRLQSSGLHHQPGGQQDHVQQYFDSGSVIDPSILTNLANLQISSSAVSHSHPQPSFVENQSADMTHQQENYPTSPTAADFASSSSIMPGSSPTKRDPPDHKKADLGYMVVYSDDHSSTDSDEERAKIQYETGKWHQNPTRARRKDRLFCDSDDDDDFIRNGRYGNDVPPDRQTFLNMDLFLHNPDNHEEYVASLLEHARQAPNKYTQDYYLNKYHEAIQNARALGWMTAGHFKLRKEAKGIIVLNETPAVHVVYADKKWTDRYGKRRTKKIVVFPKKEQDQRKREQEDRQRRKDSYDLYERDRSFRGPPISRHEYLHHLDPYLQQEYDAMEEDQFDRYHHRLKNGSLPRLHLNSRSGFRLTKSRYSQQQKRLYSDKQIARAPNEEERERMIGENAEKINNGIVKVMDQVPSSSDEDYQLPRPVLLSPALGNGLAGSSPYTKPRYNLQMEPFDNSVHRSLQDEAFFMSG